MAFGCLPRCSQASRRRQLCGPSSRVQPALSLTSRPRVLFSSNALSTVSTGCRSTPRWRGSLVPEPPSGLSMPPVTCSGCQRCGPVGGHVEPSGVLGVHLAHGEICGASVAEPGFWWGRSRRRVGRSDVHRHRCTRGLLIRLSGGAGLVHGTCLVQLKYTRRVPLNRLPAGKNRVQERPQGGSLL